MMGLKNELNSDKQRQDENKATYCCQNSRLHVASFITCMSAMSDHTAFQGSSKLLQSNNHECIFLDGNELRYRRTGLSDSLHVCLPAFHLPVNDLHSPSVKGWRKEDDDTADITAAAVSSWIILL